MQRINEFYYSYSSDIADVNRDGNLDVIAGPYYYLGPTFTVGREFYAGVTYNPTSEWPQAAMVQLAYDFTGDGWPDVLNMSGNAGNGTGTLFVNPKGENRRWDSFVVMQPPDGVVGNEETLLKDIDGDGKPEIIHTGQNTLRYSKPNPANPTGPWLVTTISEPGPWGVNISHGMGVGDINGDGLMDYVTAYGWWQQPPKGSGQKLWTYHPVELTRWGASQGGAGGAEMGIYDVNGDKLNDVVTATSHPSRLSIGNRHAAARLPVRERGFRESAVLVLATDGSGRRWIRGNRGLPSRSSDEAACRSSRGRLTAAAPDSSRAAK